jgi:hypothetical protein
MDEPATSRPERILIIGRSPGVILDAAGILRSKGFHTDATNQFDEVLTEYDTANIDVVVFGGMVPPTAKQYLTEQISKVNGHVTFVQGLAGIAGLIAAQVEGVTPADGDGNGVAYDPANRTVQLTLHEPAQVVVEAWWATSFTPPEPASTSMRVIDSRFDQGEYVIPLPAEVPPVASFVTVSAGPAVRAFTVGAMPAAVMRMVPAGDPAQPPRSLPSGRWRPTAMTDKPGAPAVRTMRAQGLVNLVVRGLLRTPGLSRIIGSRLVTLYVAGRKSGRRYTVPVSYLAHGDDLLIGTSSGWARNLRTGEPVAFRFKGKIRLADVQTLAAEPDVVTAYAHLAAANPAFARFSRVHLDHDGNASHRDLHLAWAGGARVIKLTPR